MSTIFVNLPAELLEENLSTYWKELYVELCFNFPNIRITSNYTGDGDIVSSDGVLFSYEHKDSRRYLADIDKCNELNIPYSFFFKHFHKDKSDDDKVPDSDRCRPEPEHPDKHHHHHHDHHHHHHKIHWLTKEDIDNIVEDDNGNIYIDLTKDD